MIRSVLRDIRELGSAAVFMTGALVWALLILFLVGQALFAVGVIE